MYGKDSKNIFEKNGERPKSKGVGVAFIEVVGPCCPLQSKAKCFIHVPYLKVISSIK
jgi:hypothetical protein